jgi:hypothetical protein
MTSRNADPSTESRLTDRPHDAEAVVCAPAACYGSSDVVPVSDVKDPESMTHPPHCGHLRRLPAARAVNPSRRCGARRSLARRPRILPILLVAVMALAGCGDTRPARQPEGSVAFSVSNAPPGETLTYTLPGPPFQHPGMLVPSQEQPRQPVWVDENQDNPLLTGATAGMTTGIGFMMVTPMALTFWPAAVGIVAGSVAMGMLGVAQSDSADVRLSPPDQTVIIAATKEAQPDRLLRESLRGALRSRARESLPTILWQQAGGVEAEGTDPLADAQARGLDGLLECAIEALGLAAGEERDTFGVFLQVRIRALNTHDGKVRYERVLRYGPGQTVEGLPRPDFHTIEFFATDQGRVYRQVMSDAIHRIARLLAEDPQLPLAPPRPEQQ